MHREPLEIVTSAQNAAATFVHDRHMPQWAASDRALDRLRTAIPDLDESAALIKAAAVDRLYYSRHDRIVEAARRIAEVMQCPPADPIALVEAVAGLPDEGGTSHYWSFASKFVHFFIAPEGTPIYDDWAVRTVRHHFGRLRWIGRTPYRAFAEYALGLRKASDLRCSVRELDRYLWLSGMLRGWRSDPTVGISREVRSVFESSERDVRHQLVRLTG